MNRIYKTGLPSVLPVLLRPKLCLTVGMLLIATGESMAQGAVMNESAVVIDAKIVSKETTKSLTLSQAIAFAMQNNPDISAARREVDAIEGQVLQGHARPNPELAYTLEDARQTTRTQSLQLNYPIEIGGKRSARIAAAERGLDVAKAELETRIAEVRAGVVTAFFDVLIAQERAALAKNSVGLANKTTETVIKRVVAGKVSPVEENKARLAEATVRVEFLQSENELHNARVRLSSLIGVNLSKLEAVIGSIDTFISVPDYDVIQKRLNSAPVLKRARFEVSRRKALTDIERSKRISDVTLSVGVKRQSELQRNQLLFSVSMPLPLLDRNQGNLLEAAKREEKAREELLAISNRTNAEVIQARDRFSALQNEINILQNELLPNAKKTYEAAVIGFANGKFNFLDVLDAQRTYLSVKSQHLRALADAHRVAASIDSILGI